MSEIKSRPEAYSPERAAEMLDVHPETIRREIVRGRLKAFKVGAQWRILRGDLYAYASQPRATSTH